MVLFENLAASSAGSSLSVRTAAISAATGERPEGRGCDSTGCAAPATPVQLTCGSGAVTVNLTRLNPAGLWQVTLPAGTPGPLLATLSTCGSSGDGATELGAYRSIPYAHVRQALNGERGGGVQAYGLAGRCLRLSRPAILCRRCRSSSTAPVSPRAPSRARASSSTTRGRRRRVWPHPAYFPLQSCGTVTVPLSATEPLYVAARRTSRGPGNVTVTTFCAAAPSASMTLLNVVIGSAAWASGVYELSATEPLRNGLPHWVLQGSSAGNVAHLFYEPRYLSITSNYRADEEGLNFYATTDDVLSITTITGGSGDVSFSASPTCPVSSYAQGSGLATTCSACGAYQFAPRGSTSATACKCAPGAGLTSPSSTTCAPCTGDTFRASTAANAVQCLPCRDVCDRRSAGARRLRHACVRPDHSVSAPAGW